MFWNLQISLICEIHHHNGSSDLTDEAMTRHACLWNFFISTHRVPVDITFLVLEEIPFNVLGENHLMVCLNDKFKVKSILFISQRSVRIVLQTEISHIPTRSNLEKSRQQVWLDLTILLTKLVGSVCVLPREQEKADT